MGDAATTLFTLKPLTLGLPGCAVTNTEVFNTDMISLLSTMTYNSGAHTVVSNDINAHLEYNFKIKYTT